MILPRSLDPFDNLGNHLLINTFTLFNHMNVGRVSPGYTTILGIIEELGNGFLV